MLESINEVKWTVEALRDLLDNNIGIPYDDYLAVTNLINRLEKNWLGA